jgi:hypothetical protein
MILPMGGSAFAVIEVPGDDAVRMEEIISARISPNARRNLITEKVDLRIDWDFSIEFPPGEQEPQCQKLRRNGLFQPSPKRKWKAREM